MEDNINIDCRDLDRRTPDKGTIRGIVKMLHSHADDIEELFPFQANAMRNMATVLDQDRTVSV